MTAEGAFSLANIVALVGWVVLVCFPRRRWAAPLVGGAVLPALFAVAYVGLLASGIGSSDGGFSTLAAVARLFADPWLLLAGWVHYLAFDLFVGAWQVRDAGRNGIRHRWVIPCLVLTFLAGPAGLLAYLVLRTIRRRSVMIEESTTPA